MKVGVDVRGVAEAVVRMDEIAARAADARPAFEKVGPLLYAAERAQFASGKGWAPLADSTRRRKRSAGKDPRVMRATGALERALTSPGVGGIVDMDATSLTFGIPGGRHSVYYGRFHQMGKGNPRRKVVSIPLATRREAKEVIRDHLLGDL